MRRPWLDCLSVAVAVVVVGSNASALPDVELGGLAQPQLKWEQQDPDVKPVVTRSSGFALKRARLIALGRMTTKSVKWEARLEGEMIPSFQLLDAYLAATVETAGDGMVRISFGQQWTPFSRQANTLVGDLQMADLAQFQSLVPNRQLGLLATLIVPYAPWLQISFGVYNGKGVNVIENLDSNFMYVGRVALRPMGARAPIIEGALGPTAIWLAGHFAYNTKNLGDYSETSVQAGADFFASYRGFSTYVEYYWGQYTYPSTAPKQPYKQQGFNAQAGYLLPIPGRLFRRFELTFRFEAVAPNQTVPITGPGDPTQARMSIVPGINYYHRGHDLKLQLNYLHNEELDDRDAAGKIASYKNDSVVFQLVYRLR